jgi:hypothetical protein
MKLFHSLIRPRRRESELFHLAKEICGDRPVRNLFGGWIPVGTHSHSRRVNFSKIYQFFSEM